MLRSMTGYATATAREENTAVTVTLKSVNHRFLDLNLKAPSEMDVLEMRIKQAVRSKISRGHVDVSVSLERQGAAEVRFDRAMLSGYLAAFRGVQQEFGLSQEPDLSLLLKIPGAVTVQSGPAAGPELGRTERLLFQALEEALTSLDAMRKQEAVALAAELRTRAANLERAATRIASLREGADSVFFERLRERITELTGEAAPAERVAQEAAVLVERSDVSEEVLRLRSHVTQFVEHLSGGPSGEAGKRLDFLLQEMNRESNTILSKTAGLGQVGLEITDLAIQAKAEIEKLREQVQNLQ